VGALLIPFSLQRFLYLLVTLHILDSMPHHSFDEIQNPARACPALHAFNTASASRQLGAKKTTVGCLVREAAHGAKTQIDGSGGELTGLEMRAITQDHDPVEGHARFRAIPVTNSSMA
jgi:hypothetical protein